MKLHPIIEYWPYIALAARYQYDLDSTNDKPNDYIETVLRRWHPDMVQYRPYFIGDAFSYVLELPDKILLVHLGTRNNKEMRGNFSGAIGGFFANVLPFRNKNECNTSFWKAGCETFDILKRFYLIKKPIISIGHSRGCARAVVFAIRSFQSIGQKPLTVQYEPPPPLTKKGVKNYLKNGLGECTFCVKSPNDIVVNASMFGYYHHVGCEVMLPDVPGQMADIPLVGGHAYSTVTEGLKVWAREYGRCPEGAVYLEEREFVEVC